jgi:hypothetical protein
MAPVMAQVMITLRLVGLWVGAALAASLADMECGSSVAVVSVGCLSVVSWSVAAWRRRRAGEGLPRRAYIVRVV